MSFPIQVLLIIGSVGCNRQTMYPPWADVLSMTVRPRPCQKVHRKQGQLKGLSPQSWPGLTIGAVIGGPMHPRPTHVGKARRVIVSDLHITARGRVFAQTYGKLILAVPIKVAEGRVRGAIGSIVCRPGHPHPVDMGKTSSGITP